MDIMHITIWDVLIAFGTMLIVLVISLSYRLTIEKDLAIGTIRCFIQLIVAGYVLKWVFGLDNWYSVLGMLILMTLIAGYHAVRRVEKGLNRSIIYATGGIVIGASIIICLTFGLILRIKPFYNPQYVIPIGGMIINGAMNGISVGMASFKNSVGSNVDYIDSALALGAKGEVAVRSFYRHAIKTALIPTINGLMTVGIVQFPGLMSGQIIAGADPTQAVLYQIVIMFILASAKSISVIIGLKFYARSFFNKAHQLQLR